MDEYAQSRRVLGVSLQRPWEVLKRVFVGTFDTGLTHAGNLAFLSLLTLFPFFVIIGAMASVVGRSGDGLRAIRTFLETVPPRVADLLAEPIGSLLRDTGSGLLTFSILVALWTTASYVETIRFILYNAYGFTAARPIWQRRLLSFGIIIASVVLMLTAFTLQFVLAGVEEFMVRWIPGSSTALVEGLRVAPMVALFVALYLLFTSLTPRPYRRGWPKWPGALATTLMWIGATNLLPWILSNFSNTDQFYGPLAGVMVTLIFFYIVGLGFVVGAHLNAALASTAKDSVGGENLELDIGDNGEPIEGPEREGST